MPVSSVGRSPRPARARSTGYAARELLSPDLPVAPNLRDEPLREGVDDGDTDAVEPAGDLVAVAAELAAGMELREDDGERREVLILDHVDRDAPSVVDDRDRVVGVQPHLDEVVVARERLVDGVVDDLVDQVVETPRAGRADVHPGPEPDGLEPFENGDVLCRCMRCRPRASWTRKMPAKQRFCGRS